jgi:hypothetical protein
MSSQSSTFSSGGSPTQAQVNGWAQGTLGYAQVTANQGSITAEVDLTSLTVTVTVVAGRRLKITGSVTYSNSTANAGMIVYIKEGGTYLGRGTGSHGVANQEVTPALVAVVTPSAGSHTYKLSAQSQNGGTATTSTVNSIPLFIHVEDVGAT